jgi:plasmid stability protein
MPSLPIRNIPNKLLRQIQRLAKARGNSLNTQVIVLLNQALQHENAKDRKAQINALSSIRQRRFILPKNSPSSLTLLREDRRR